MKAITETWCCVENCGACCNLTPEDRPDLADYLTPEELETYLAMVGEDGWCINYDQNTRKCKIYADRPRFCRVELDNFQQMYDIAAEEFNEFAIACCRDQISDVYGDESPEMTQYDRGVRI
jgi:uncharacterized protein